MITAAQLRAARALVGLDQRKLAELSGLSVPTIQRMEASEGVIRGNVDSLVKLVAALDAAGIELIAGGAVRRKGGRGVRPKGGGGGGRGGHCGGQTVPVARGRQSVRLAMPALFLAGIA